MGLFRIRRKVEICIENLAFAQHGSLNRLGLLYLDDHFGAAKNFLCRPDNFGANGLIILVQCADITARICFHQNFMPTGSQFPGAFRCQSDTVFVIFDFLGCSDDHAVLSPRQINFE